MVISNNNEIPQSALEGSENEQSLSIQKFYSAVFTLNT